MLYIANIEYTEKVKQELLKLEIDGLLKFKEDCRIVSMTKDLQALSEKINSIFELDDESDFYGFNKLDGEYLKNKYGRYMLQEKEYKFCKIEITGYDLSIDLLDTDLIDIYYNNDFKKTIERILGDRLRKRLKLQLKAIINNIDEWELKSL